MDKLFKSGVLRMGNAEELVPERLPTGIAPLDQITGGGLQLGTCTLLVGPESTGKTLLSQYIAASVQKTERPNVLFLDAERSYDVGWWAQSGVETNKLYVARPSSAEELIDITTQVLTEDPTIGLVILDSIAAMPPTRIINESAERHDIGSLARLVQHLYVKIVPLLGKTIFLATNQIRDNITGYEERYPGGHSQRYFSHMILRTRREGWIQENNKRIGFNLEVTTRKNKTAAPQQSCSIPFHFQGQLDMASVLIDEAIASGRIQQNLPYYKIEYEGKLHNLLGKANLRAFVVEHPDSIQPKDDT